jgi:NADPH-dependent ferric siderophore reductase
MISNLFQRLTIALVLAAMTLPAHAQMVSTGDAMALESGALESRIEAFLLRDDVAAELAQHGVSHDMAMARVESMSAAELQQVAGRLDEMPAGESVVWIAGAVFIVLIILEFVGVTNVFTKA